MGVIEKNSSTSIMKTAGEKTFWGLLGLNPQHDFERGTTGEPLSPSLIVYAVRRPAWCGSGDIETEGR